MSGEEIELIGLPICAAPADRVNALETLLANLANRITTLEAAP